MALYHRIKRQIMSRVQLVRVGLVLLLVGGSILLWWGVIRPLSKKAHNLVDSYNVQLPAVSGRTNFLLLGLAGGNHDGADLTDTMIFVSIDTNGKVSMLSIPRDIWVPSMRAKINTAYHYGEAKQPDGGGFTLAKAAVTEVIGQPVQFVALINFSNFEKVIDALGGVDINVEQTFDDNEFPITGKEDDLCDGDLEYKCRYEHLHFDAGMTHMNGELALKYVRSRHAIGEEGTDFARSKRQEKLLLALKDKLVSGGILTHPQQLQSLYNSVSESLTMDLTGNYYPALVKLGIKIVKNNQINSATLQIPDQIYHPEISKTYDNQWVLLPKDNDWKIISNFVTELLSR